MVMKNCTHQSNCSDVALQTKSDGTRNTRSQTIRQVGNKLSV